jgi:hypothetical protein
MYQLVLAGRATSAIHSSRGRSPADTHGQRYGAHELRRSLSSLGSDPVRCGLGSRSRFVEVCIGLAVPGQPIRSLVAEDRSASGVRDQAEPETQSVRAGSVPGR